MNNHLNRLIAAALISLASLTLVVSWYYYATPQVQDHAGETPVAYVQNIKDDVERKPVKRQVWELLNEGEPIFSGEAIRTTATSEVSVKFIEGHKAIDIEPESIIMITQGQNKDFALDLVEGGVSVKDEGLADNKDQSQLNIVQNGKSISVTGNATLSKTNGNLEISGGKFSENIEALNKILNPFFVVQNDPDFTTFKLIEPSSTKIIYADQVANALKIKWSGLTKKTSAKVFYGQKRKNLNQSVEVFGSEADLKLNSGFSYFKINFYDEKKNVLAESKIQKIKIIERNWPILLSPLDKQEITLEKNLKKANVLLSWSSDNYIDKMSLELSHDKTFAKKILNKTFDKKTLNYLAELEAGEYFFRILSTYQSDIKVRTSKISTFNVVPFKSLPEQNKETLALVQPAALEKIEWRNPNQDEEQSMTTDSKIALQWLLDKQQKIKKYKITLKHADSEKKIIQETGANESSADVRIVAAGRYIASIDGLDETQKVIAHSSLKKIIIKDLELLAAPEIEGALNKKANRDGDISIKWLPLKGSKSYEYVLLNKSGRKIESQTLLNPNTMAKLTGLLPGQYTFEVKGIDQLGRSGPIARVKLDVTNTSGLAAPIIKKLKVK